MRTGILCQSLTKPRSGTIVGLAGQPLLRLMSHRSVTTTDQRGGGRAVRSQSPDHEADFDDFVRGHLQALAGFGRLLAGDDVRGQDLVQEALARTYLRWRRSG